MKTGRQLTKPTPACERLLDVPLGRLLGADRQVADEHVGLGLLEDADDVGGLARGLGDLLLQVLAEPVVGHAALDLDAQLGDVGELDRVVLARPDRLGEVLADLLGVDVEGGDELDVADVVAAEVDVHQARDLLVGIGVLVVLDALDEAVGAVADADDRDADLAVVGAAAVARRRRWRGRWFHSCGKRSSCGAGEKPYYPRFDGLVTPRARQAASAASSALSSPRTCQTRWPTVNAVSPAIA